MIVSVWPDIMKLTRTKNVHNVNPSVQLVPLVLIIVTLVLQTEETKFQSAHAQTVNMKMEKMFANIVTINV